MHLKLLQKEQFKKQHNSVTNEEEIFRERYISSEERQKIIDDLRLV